MTQTSRKALVVSSETPPKVALVPTGAGQPRVLDLGPIESVAWAGWHPDGRIVIELVRPGGKPVVYALSPDGRLLVCTLAAPASRPLPGARDEDDVAGWSADNRSVFVYRKQDIPVQVERLDVLSGTRSAWRTVRPAYAAVCGLTALIAAPDGDFAYAYGRTRSELYVIKGLK